MSFSPTFAKPFHVEWSNAVSNVRVIAASGETKIADFRVDPELDAAGIYIVFDGRHAYVGGAGSSVSFRSSRFTDGTHLPPSLMLGIVGADRPLEFAEAFALERIAHQSLAKGRWRMRNRKIPAGKPLGEKGYARVQMIWSAAIALLRPVFPDIACPWRGPDYLDVNAPRDPYAERRRAKMRDISASVRSVGDGWCVEAGSEIRRDLGKGAEDVARVMRDELQHIGALVPMSEETYLLTRDVRRPTLSAASGFVFTVSGSTHWIPVDDREDDALFNPPQR